VKVLEDIGRGIERGASGCTRAEEAEEAVEVVVEEVVVEMVVETMAAETMVVETMVVMAERAMTGVGMMAREGKTEEYAKERKQDRENRKSKEGKLKGGINRGKRTDIPHLQDLTHSSHFVTAFVCGWASCGPFKINGKSKA
jgi:hypothetical protein